MMSTITKRNSKRKHKIYVTDIYILTRNLESRSKVTTNSLFPLNSFPRRTTNVYFYDRILSPDGVIGPVMYPTRQGLSTTSDTSSRDTSVTGDSVGNLTCV